VKIGVISNVYYLGFFIRTVLFLHLAGYNNIYDTYLVKCKSS